MKINQSNQKRTNKEEKKTKKKESEKQNLNTTWKKSGQKGPPEINDNKVTECDQLEWIHPESTKSDHIYEIWWF